MKKKTIVNITGRMYEEVMRRLQSRLLGGLKSVLRVDYKVE